MVIGNQVRTLSRTGIDQGRDGAVNIVRRSDLDELTAPMPGQSHVSLFVPMTTCGRHAAQNPIRWKNLLVRTEAALRGSADPAEVAATLAAVRMLTPDRLPATPHTGGLAVFARPDWWRCFRVPFELPELSAVGDRFLIAPLLHVAVPAHRFLVLALNQTRVRLFTGTRFALEQIPADRLPAGPASPTAARTRDAMSRPDAFLAGRGGSRNGAVFYGRGGFDQQRHEETLQYFRTVDAMLPTIAGGERLPLLLAGVGHLIALYRQISRYRYLAPTSLASDPARLSTHALHSTAWDLLEPQLRHDESAAVKRFRDLSGTAWTLREPAQVLRAARAGRIDVLLLAETTFTRSSSHPPPVLKLANGSGSVADQLDQAAAHCLANGGRVYMVPAERMPHASAADESPVAALLRF